MNKLALEIEKQKTKIWVKLDADKLERLASVLGLYNPDFLASVGRAERDYTTGKTKKISSLKALRK